MNRYGYRHMNNWGVVNGEFVKLTLPCLNCGGATGEFGPSTWGLCHDCYSGHTVLTNKVRREHQDALASGRLERATAHKCADCGKQAQAWEHRDYRKPETIQPVCNSCNQIRGPAVSYFAMSAFPRFAL